MEHSCERELCHQTVRDTIRFVRGIEYEEINRGRPQAREKITLNQSRPRIQHPAVGLQGAVGGRKRVRIDVLGRVDVTNLARTEEWDDRTTPM